MIKKISSAIAGAAIFGSMMVPAAFADNTIDISGNGANSTNKVTLNSSCTNVVSQSNSSVVGVTTDVSQNTGGNKANSNTGGDVSITTGDATSSVSVTVAGSTNEIGTLPDCACICQTGLDINITDNGANSTNKVKKTTTIVQTVGQGNSSTVGVGTKVKQKTGKNKAKKNTGGTTTVTTGAADSTVDVTVNAPSNTL